MIQINSIRKDMKNKFIDSHVKNITSWLQDILSGENMTPHYGWVLRMAMEHDGFKVVREGDIKWVELFF